MSKSNRVSRRGFLGASASAIAAPYFVPGSALGLGGTVAPSERIVIGHIGVGGMGRGNMGAFMRNKDVQVVAVCDVDKNNMNHAKNQVDKRYKSKDCKGYDHFQELLGREDIDAVCIATPDHWHAKCCVEAANNKKHIYCQKPMTHTFAEGQAVVAAVKKNDVRFQVGSQQRSSGNFRRAAELVQNGVLGKLKHVEVGLPQGNRNPPAAPNPAEKIPGHIDYNFWVGPSQMVPFISKRFHFHWRWHLNFGGGQLMDWIGHHNDIAHWGMGMDKSGPVEVQASGFKYPKKLDVFNAAYHYKISCKYANGVTTTITSNEQNAQGAKWYGEDGSWIYVRRGRLDASNKEWIKGGFDAGPKKVYHSPEHHRNFLDGCKNSKPCICTAEIGHRSITPGHLGLLSQALGGKKLKWDPENEKIIGDVAADKLLKAVDYRKPWTL